MAYNKIRFGRNLQLLRSQREVSQQELADAIHVTRQSISTWERGAGKPDIFCLHDISEYFGVSLEQLMYEKVIEKDVPISYEEPEYIDYVKSFDAAGLYTIIDEDLEEFFPILRYDVGLISVTAMALHKYGYLITEVFDNGFSVYLRNDKEAREFHSRLYDVLDCFIHHDNDYMEERRQHVEDKLGEVSYEVLMYAMKEIFGAPTNEFNFYWVDEMENPRGYANTEEECKEQASIQCCEKYTVLPVR